MDRLLHPGASGQAFWQEESYDHLVRTEAEFDWIRCYVEGHPVVAGLVAEAQEHPWSSAAAPESRLQQRFAAPHFITQ